jgi:hypothetical protein
VRAPACPIHGLGDPSSTRYRAGWRRDDIAARVKAVRARALIRRWEYRQRNLAHGAWGRFRGALVHARDAYEIDDPTAAALLAEGGRRG